MKIQMLIENTTKNPELIAEHGLSLYIETGDQKILFDTGQTGAFADNAARLGVDLSAVDLVVLSHGHYDHGGGLRRFLTINDHAPVYLSRYAFEPHYSGTEKNIGLDQGLQESGRLVYTQDYLQLGDGIELYSCQNCRLAHAVDSYGLNTVRNGMMMPDDFRHEQYLVITSGKARIVFSGCSHRGILNIVTWLKPSVLVGGFHFKSLDAGETGRQVLDKAATVLLSAKAVFYTCHCTGEPAYRYLKERMTDRLHYLSTGQILVQENDSFKAIS